jgi:hypothetical protein
MAIIPTPSLNWVALIGLFSFLLAKIRVNSKIRVETSCGLQVHGEKF